MTKILLALAVASLVTACDGQWTEWSKWNACSCLRVMGGGYRLRTRESNTASAQTDYGVCDEQMCPPCPVTPACTADGCVMAVHDECWVLNVLDITTDNANAAKSACVAAYGDAAQLPEAATQADLDAIFALSQTYHEKPVWMSATSETVGGSWSWESGTDVEADLWKQGYPKSDSTPDLCSIVYNKSNKKSMVNRQCVLEWLRSVVCAAPIVHDTSDSGADTQRPHTCADVSGSNPRQVAVLFDGTEVLCDTATDGGGWLVFQRRMSSETDFYRGWEDYKTGFGDINGNFWMGLESIHDLTSRRRYELRVDLTYDGRSWFASYDNFMVSSEADKFRLTVSGYTGEGHSGDNLAWYHDNQPFSTKDQDNDAFAGGHCAQRSHGGWWYKGCHRSNLNGQWGSKKNGAGVNWGALTTFYDSATSTEMKMRLL